MECEINFDNQGQSIAIQRFGSPNNPAILAIHGWLDNGNSFLPLTRQLTEYCLYAIDLPGHGLSSHLPAFANYHFIDGVTLVHQLVEKLFKSPPHLLGHSLGGCIASLAAPVLKDKIQSLILLDALGPLTSIDSEAYNQYSSFITKRTKIRESDKTRGIYKSRTHAAAMRAKSGYLSEELAEILCDRALQKNDDGYFFRHDRKLLLPSAMKMTEKMVMSFLQELTTPCLFLEASDGFSYDRAKMKERLKAPAQLTHKVIEGGHHFHMESPQKTSEEIRAFLQRNTPSEN